MARTQRRFAGVLLALVVAGGCGDSEPRGAASTASCEDRVSAAKAEVATMLASGTTRGDTEELVQRIEALPILAAPQCGQRGWASLQLAAWLEDAATDLVKSMSADDLLTRARANVMVFVAAHLRPAPTYDVPDGFPQQFPVPDGAHLVSTDHDGRSVSAVWQLPLSAMSFEGATTWFDVHLQQRVPGRWQVSGIRADGSRGGRTHSWTGLTGYGMRGTVGIALNGNDAFVIIEAQLAP